jgi:hypothetical protein
VSPEPKEDKGGLQLSTLLISSLAAVAAAVIVPTFWERGSLIAVAVTPIVVALVTEALNRPAKVITSVPTRVTRRTGTGAAVRAEQPTGVGARGEGPERVGRWGDEDDPFGLRTPERPRRRLPWKLGIVTGLVAAVIGAGIVTASELAIFGHSVSGKERSTSVFGGSNDAADDAEETPTATPSATEEETVTPEATATPEATETATAAPSATPTATPPAEATPTPQVAPTTTPTIAPTP